VGVGLCANPDVDADIITTSASAIATAIRRTWSNPVVCRVPEDRDVQHMTTIPKQNGARKKATVAARCNDLCRTAVDGQPAGTQPPRLLPRLWFRCHRSQIAEGCARAGLEIRARLA
jgi:hypothetical protein